MMKMITTVYKHKQETKNQQQKQRLDEYRQIIQAREAGKSKNIKRIKKEVMRNRSKKEASKKN